MKGYFLFVVMLSGIIWMGCEEQVGGNSDDGLSVSLLVRYMQGERELKGQALFYATDTSGHTVAEPFPTHVTFMAEPTRARPLPGNSQRYEHTLIRDYPDEVFFTIPDERGKPQRVVLPMPGISDFSFGGTLSLRQGGLLTVQNQPLSADERLVLLLTDSSDVTRTLIVQGPTNQTTIRLEAKLLANLSPGEYTVYIVRKRNWRSTEQGRVINKSVEFYSVTKRLTVVE